MRDQPSWEHLFKILVSNFHGNKSLTKDLFIVVLKGWSLITYSFVHFLSHLKQQWQKYILQRMYLFTLWFWCVQMNWRWCSRGWWKSNSCWHRRWQQPQQPHLHSPQEPRQNGSRQQQPWQLYPGSLHYTVSARRQNHSSPESKAWFWE